MVIVLIAATSALIGILLFADRTDASWRLWPKAAASTGFIAIAVASGAADTAYGRWVLVALALGWIGDVALVSKHPAWFLIGLGAFLLSHLAYIGAFGVLGMRGIAAGVTLGLLVIPAIVIGRWLMPHVPRDMRVPVLAYVMVITAMVAAATGAASNSAPWPVLPAAVMFYASDLFVARERFVTPNFGNRAIGLPLYYGAQILFAVSTGIV
jgi:uncharacterized membrane protein YhhN